MSVSSVSRSQQSETFAHFFPSQSRENDTVRLFAKALLPLLNQQWYLNTDRILHKIRSFKDQMKVETYEKCLNATQKYLNSRDFSVAGRYEVKKSWFFSGIQSYGETPRFQQLNKGLETLLKEVQPRKTSWSESFRACWNGFIDCCSSAVSYTYNNPGKTACTFLALETAALAVRSYQQNSTFDVSTSIVPWGNSPESHWSCGSNLVFGLSGTLLTQNPIFITAAGASCMPMAYGQIVNGQVSNQLLNVGDSFSLDINMTELFGEPVTNVMISQSDGSALPDWLNVAPMIVGSLATTSAYGVAISGNIAYVADGYGGLRIIDVSDSTNPILKSSLNTTGAYGVTISNNIAYLADRRGGLRIIDVSDSTNPVLKGSLATTYALGVAISGNITYIADDKGGLRIIDVSDSTNPVLKGSLATTYAQGVAMSGNSVYVADDKGGLRIIDVSDSTNPILKSSLPSTSAREVAISGNNAYVADFDGGLQIIDVSNSTHPILKGSFPTIDIHGVVISGNVAYVADSGLKIIDVSDSTNPILKSSLSISSAWGVAINGNVAYVADYDRGLRIVDLAYFEMDGVPITSKKKYNLLVSAKNGLFQEVNKKFSVSTDYFPTAVNSIKTPQSVILDKTLTLNINVNNLFQDKDAGDTLSLSLGMQQSNADALPGFMQLKVKPFVQSSLPMTSAWGVAVSGNMAYVADEKGGLRIIDVSDSTNPVLKGSLATTSAYGVAISGNMAYVADFDGGLRIIDVSDSTHPILKSSLPTSAANGVTINGNVAYVADLEEGLRVIDVSNSSNPILKGSLQTTRASGVAISDNVAYVSSETGGLSIIDVSNSSNPILKSSLPTSEANGVAVSSDIAYVADSDGLKIIDVSNSTNPILKGSLATTFAQGVAISGNVAYVADHFRGLSIIDVSNSSNPILKSILSTSDALGVAISGNVAYVVDRSSMKIIDLTNYQFIVNPSHGDEKNYELVVNATDRQLGSASIPFELRVVGTPKFQKSLPSQNAIIGETFTSDVIPSDTFLDPNEDQLSYSAKPGSLPSGITFDSTSNSLKGIPNGSTRDYNVTIFATKKDNSYKMASAEAIWTISVHHAPYVNKPLKNQVINIGSPWFLTLPQNAFTHPDNYLMTYRAMQEGLDSLPSWMHFDNQNLVFDGVPKEEDEFNVVVEANDGKKGTAKSSFRLIAEHYPSLAKNFSTIYTAPGHPFTFEAFSYFANSNALQYNAKLPSEHLYFDGDYCRLKGVFSSNEMGTKFITITATDKNAAPLQAEFNITVMDYAEVLNKNNSQEVTVENRAPTINDFLVQQLFKAGQERSFSVANSFLDADGDQLTYRADVGDARWLTLNPLTGEFSGAPSDRDAAFYTDRRYTIGVSATDPKGEKATGTFEILLEGPSFAQNVFSGFMSAGGVAVALFGYFQKRYLLWNWFRKSKYQKQPLEVSVGQREIFYQVSHPVGRISSIAVTTIKDNRCVKRESFWPDMFKDTETRTFLGGTKARIALLDWLDYDPADNQFHIAKDGPDDTYLVRDISVQIVDLDGRIMEEVPIVVRSNVDPSVAQELRENQKATLSAASSAIHEEVQLSVSSSSSSSSVSSPSQTSTESSNSTHPKDFAA